MGQVNVGGMLNRPDSTNDDELFSIGNVKKNIIPFSVSDSISFP